MSPLRHRWGGATALRCHFPGQVELHLVVADEFVRCSVDDLPIADDKRDPSQRLFGRLAQLLPSDGRMAAVEGWFEPHRMSAGSDAIPDGRVIVESAHRFLADRPRQWRGPCLLYPEQAGDIPPCTGW